jgi:hypothetical protein
VAKLFADAGIICITSLISPYRKDRDACRALLPDSRFIEVSLSYDSLMSSATVFLGYQRCNWRNLRFPLISAVNFYYVINKLIRFNI